MSPRAAAWGIFAVGLVVLFILGVFVMFLSAQATTGCDQSFGPAQTHPEYCESEPLKTLIVLLAPLLGVVYTIGSVVGIIIMRAWRWVALIPAALVVSVGFVLAVEVILLT